VTAPILVLLYDRTFLAGDFGSALRQRPAVYAGLACSWILLVYLMAGSHEQGVGFGLGASAWNYALTECRALTHYLRLAVWPHSLVFDYDLALDQRWSAVAGDSLLLAAPWPSRSWPYGVGRPSASSPAVFFSYSRPLQFRARRRPAAGGESPVPAAGGAAHPPRPRPAPRTETVDRSAAPRPRPAGRRVDYRRNRDYASDLTIWRDTVAKCPPVPGPTATWAWRFFRHGDKAAARRKLPKPSGCGPATPSTASFSATCWPRRADPRGGRSIPRGGARRPQPLPAREALQRLAP